MRHARNPRCRQFRSGLLAKEIRERPARALQITAAQRANINAVRALRFFGDWRQPGRWKAASQARARRLDGRASGAANLRLRASRDLAQAARRAKTQRGSKGRPRCLPSAAKRRNARSISPRRLDTSCVMTSRRALGLAASCRLHHNAQAASSEEGSAA